MLEIKHKETGKVLESIDSETLAAADLRDMRLGGADLSNRDLSGSAGGLDSGVSNSLSSTFSNSRHHRPRKPNRCKSSPSTQ